MKILMISMIICVVWIALQGKNFMSKLPQGLPKAQVKSDELNQLPVWKRLYKSFILPAISGIIISLIL